MNATIDPIIENGWLNGSNVSLSYSTSDNAKIDSISSWHVEVHYKDNGIDNIIRTYDSSSAPNSTTTIMTPVENWPYVPKESEITAYVVIKDDTIHVNTSKTVKPISFVVEVSGDTSYSVYDRSGATAANEKNGSSIFNIGSTVKISSAILGNSNYANILPKVTYTTDTGKSSGELAYNASVNDFTGLAWQKHVLTATASFDGASASASMDCHVTGLPYSKDFRTDSSTDGWVFSGTTGYDKDWGQWFLYVYSASTKAKKRYAKIYSPAHYTPNDININYTFGCIFYNSWTYNRNLSLYSGLVNNCDNYSTSGVATVTSNDKYTTYSYEVVLQNSQRLSFYHNEWYRADGTQYWLYLSTLEIKYR